MKKKSIRFTIKEQIHFSKRLSFLLKAGTSVSDSLILLGAQASRKKELFNSLIADVAQGNYLYQSLKKFPKTFSPLAISLTRSGEESGTLAENFGRLATELQKRQRFQQKMISALVYPSFIALATILLSCFLLFFIFPKIRPLFSSLSISLPLSTRILIYISNISLLSCVIFLISSAVFLYILRYFYKRSNRFKTQIASLTLKIPIIGKCIRQHEIVSYLYTVGIMLQGGGAIDHACAVGSEVCKNILFKNATFDIFHNIVTGKSFSESLSSHARLFPKEISDMIATAETAGTLSETLIYISEMYELELEETTKNLSSTLEPLLMIGMGLVVGFISLSIITPIYSLTQNIKH